MEKSLKEEFEEVLPELPKPDDATSVHEGIEEVEEVYQKGRRALREILVARRSEGKDCRKVYGEVLATFHMAMLATREEWHMSSLA